MKNVLFHLVVGLIVASAITGAGAAAYAFVLLLQHVGAPKWLAVGFTALVVVLALASWAHEDHRKTFGGRRT